MPRNIAYLRVSVLNQDLEKNKSGIPHLANEKNQEWLRLYRKKDQARFSGSNGKLVPYWRT